jgi:hypothetical protein
MSNRRPWCCTRLVPRFIAVLGLVGGPLICASAVAVMFGTYAQLSVAGAAAALPVFAWELGLAGWLIVKGFGPGSGSASRADREVADLWARRTSRSSMAPPARSTVPTSPSS